MYLQRVEVAGSSAVQLILTSSLSVGLNGFYPIRFNQVGACDTCYKKKRIDF